MGPIEKHMREECRRVLKLVDSHLSEYPMGETYFGVKAGVYPKAIPNLRADKIVGPVTLDGLERFVAKRKALLSGAENVGEGGE